MCGETESRTCMRGCGAYSCRMRSDANTRMCCDSSGCCCNYLASCRNPYWPEFAHPRWLSCADLYDGNESSCYENDNNSGCCCE